ncbi:MAG: restriction endonuclease subunit S [Balneolaceae bacterium]
MKKSWKEFTIQDLVDKGEAELKTGPFGTQLKADEYVDMGTPVINVRNIGFGSIRESKLEFLDNNTVERLSSHLLKRDDIVFGRKGAVERHAFINEKYANWFQGSDCLRLRINSSSVLPRFLSYHFLTEQHKKWMMQQCSHGATMASLNQDIVSRIPITLPPVKDQKQIVNNLSAFDDLIENNSRRIEILEEMARLIYREWFVYYRYPGHENDKLVESETDLGEIPEGWSLRRLDDFGRIETGKTPSKKDAENYGDYMHFIKTPDMHDQFFILETAEQLSKKGSDTQKKKTLPPNSICVSCIGTAGVIALTSSSSQTNQQINSIIIDFPNYREFLYYAIKDLTPTMEKIGSSGATMTNVNKSKFQGLEVLYPKKSLIEQYHKKAAPIFNQILVLQKQNIKLKEARDLLLPKLISGKVEV